MSGGELNDRLRALSASLRNTSTRQNVAIRAYKRFRRLIEPKLVSPEFGRVYWDNISPEEHEQWVAQGVLEDTLVIVANSIRVISLSLPEEDGRSVALFMEFADSLRKIAES